MPTHRLLTLLVCGLLCACSSKETVVVYSPHGADILEDYERAFEEAHPNVDVQWLDMVSQQVYNRIYSERGRPQADVWWGAPSDMFMRAADNDLLAPYRPTWADEVDAAYHDPNDLWYGTHRTPLSIMYNTRGYSRDELPHTWDELLDPKWDQKITIRKPPESGTMRTFIGGMILKEGSADAGLDWLRKLHEATKSYLETPQLLFDHLKRNEELITVWIMPDAVLQRDRHGYPFDFLLPPNTPVLTEGIAIVKDAPHREWAEKFYEFVTTQDALAHQAETYGKIPTRNDVPEAALPGWMVEQPIDAMDIDWHDFAEKLPEWVKRWEQEVYAAP